MKEITQKQLTLSDDKLDQLYKQFKPVVRGTVIDGRVCSAPNRSQELYYIAEDTDPRQLAFNWYPVFTEKATDLIEVGRVPTFHRSLPNAFFTPSIEEVLASIETADIPKNTVAFEVTPRQDRRTYGPDRLTSTITILYARK